MCTYVTAGVKTVIGSLREDFVLFVELCENAGHLVTELLPLNASQLDFLQLVEL